MRRDHRLALQRGDLHHVAVHRGFDAGVGQVDLGGIQAGLVAGDLRIDGAHLRFLHRQLRRCLIQILTRYRLQFGQCLVALQRDRRQLLLGLCLQQLRMQLAQRRLAFANAVLRLLRIDNPQQLAFFHLVADLDIQLFQLPADLRADVNLAHRVQLAGRQHVLLQIALGDLYRFESGWRRMAEVPNGRRGNRRNHRQCEYPAAFVSFKPCQN